MVFFKSKKKNPKQLLSNFQAEIRKSAKQLEAELKIGVAYKKKSVQQANPKKTFERFCIKIHYLSVLTICRKYFQVTISRREYVG